MNLLPHLAIETFPNSQSQKEALEILLEQYLKPAYDKIMTKTAFGRVEKLAAFSPEGGELALIREVKKLFNKLVKRYIEKSL